jgi:hypothetical protein
VANLWSGLRAGGAVLVTVPCLSRIDTVAPQSDYWRWTANGLERLLRENCPGARLEASAGGNLITCQAALLGLAAEDLSDRDFVPDDPAFPLVAWRWPANRRDGGCGLQAGLTEYTQPGACEVSSFLA